MDHAITLGWLISSNGKQRSIINRLDEAVPQGVQHRAQTPHLL